LNFVVVDTNRSTTSLVSIDDQIVRLSARLTRIGIQVLQVFFQRRGKGMMHGNPTIGLGIVLEHGELGHPRKIHRLRIVKFELRTDAFSQSVECFTADFPSIGNNHHQIPWLGLHPSRDLCQFFGLEIFGNG